MTGRWIVVVSWLCVAVFTVFAGLNAAGLDAIGPAVTGGSFVLFAIAIGVWVWAFGLALVRSTRGDDIAVSNLFFLSGSAPAPVRRHLLGAVAVSVVVAAATSFANPMTVLVPMLPLGLAGLWGARHGTFPPRPARPYAAGRTPRGGRR